MYSSGITVDMRAQLSPQEESKLLAAQAFIISTLRLTPREEWQDEVGTLWIRFEWFEDHKRFSLFMQGYLMALGFDENGKRASYQSPFGSRL